MVDTVDSKSALSNRVLVRVQSSALILVALMNFLQCDAIFFDFDGLLVNTEHLHFEAYRQMMLQNDASFPWDFPTFASVAHKSSTGLRKMITAHAPKLVEQKGWDTLYNEKKACYQALLKQGCLELMSGAEEILNRVKESKIPHCVVTNSTKEQVELIQEHLPILKQIPLWVTREDYDNPKPAPDGYLKAIELLKASGKMVGFEDALRGIRSLQGAKIDPILICSPDHPQMEEVSHEDFPHFSSFHQMLNSHCL